MEQIPQQGAKVDLRRLQQIGKIDSLDAEPQPQSRQAWLVGFTQPAQLLAGLHRGYRAKTLEQHESKSACRTGQRRRLGHRLGRRFGRRDGCLHDVGLLNRRCGGDFILCRTIQHIVRAVFRRWRARPRRPALGKRRGLGCFKNHQPAKNLANMLGDKFGQSGVQPLCLVNRQQFAGDQVRAGCVKPVTLDQTGHNGVAPTDPPLFIKFEGCRRRCGEGPHTRLDLVGKPAPRRRQDGCLLLTLAQGRAENKPFQMTDFLTFDQNGTVTFHRGHEIPCFLQFPAQMRSAPVDEPLRKPLMQAVGQAVLDRTRPILPFRGVVCPVRTMRDIGPGPDIGKPRHQRVDIAIKPVELRHRPPDHVTAKPAGLGKLAIECRQQIVMIIAQTLPEIRNTGDIPQQVDLPRANSAFADRRPFGKRRQRAVIDGVSLAKQERQGRRRLKRGKQRADRGEINIA